MIDRVGTVLGRLTLIPLLTRAGVLATATAGLLLALPPELYAAPVLAGLVLLATVPAIAPDRLWPTVVIAATALLWLAGTELYDQRVDLLRVLLLAAFLYLLHALAALAAALPYDAVVAPDLAPRWLLRTLAVIGCSSLLSAAALAGLAAVTERTGNRAHVAATLAGLALAVAVAALLRRPLVDGHIFAYRTPRSPTSEGG